jgi:hypothetical protein
VSLQTFALSADLPIYQALQVAQDHKFVALNLHVSVHYTQVDASGIQKLLVLAFSTPKKVEMALQKLT